MPSSVMIPLQVLGLGIIISYAIALIMQIMLVAIRFFSKRGEKDNSAV